MNASLSEETDTPMTHQAELQSIFNSRGAESLAEAFEQVLNARIEAAAFFANPSEDAPENGAPGYRPGIPNRGPLAVSRFFSGSVATVWTMLKEPLVPLTRKEGLRCSRAQDINIDFSKRKNGRKERRYGNFATTNLMPGANVNAGLSWLEHGRIIRPNPPRESLLKCRRFCCGLMQSNRVLPELPTLER